MRKKKQPSRKEVFRWICSGKKFFEEPKPAPSGALQKEKGKTKTKTVKVAAAAAPSAKNLVPENQQVTKFVT